MKVIIINEEIDVLPNEKKILNELSEQNIHNKHIIECLDQFNEKNEIVFVFELCQVRNWNIVNTFLYGQYLII